MRLLSTFVRGALVMTIFLSMTSASTQRASAKGVVGLQHQWSYLYQAGDNQVVLNVTINEWNPRTQRVLRKLGDFAYKFGCHTGNGHVTCDMDIQASIEDAYDQVGHPQAVPAWEGYDIIITEATGRWVEVDFGQQAALAGHSSVSFGFQTSTGSDVQFRSWADSSIKVLYSAAFQPAQHELYVMGSVIERPQGPKLGGQSFYLKQNGQTTPLGEVKYGASPSFQLSANRLQITPVNGFELQSFLVDPQFGQGG